MKRGMGDGDVILKKKEELTSEEKLGAGPGEKPEKRSTENTRKKTAADKSDTVESAVKKPKRRSSADKTTGPHTTPLTTAFTRAKLSHIHKRPLCSTVWHRGYFHARAAVSV